MPFRGSTECNTFMCLSKWGEFINIFIKTFPPCTNYNQYY